MTEPHRPLSINSSAITIAGVGGLGMVAMVVLIAADLPAARWLLISGLAGGALIAGILVIRLRRRPLGGASADLPTSLSAASHSGGNPTP